MKKNEIILATDEFGNDTTISDIENWIIANDKDNLSSFFYNRLYSRYIKPFDYNNDDYIKNYKNGFAMIASSCLLIETYVSFVEPFFIDTNKKSEKCFGWFFNNVKFFSKFSKNGLEPEEYLSESRINNKGIPQDFYFNVRCGILHNAETRNKWKITRIGKTLFDETTKTIDATLFLKYLKIIISEHVKKLKDSNIDDEIWKTYIDRLSLLIKKSK